MSNNRRPTIVDEFENVLGEAGALSGLQRMGAELRRHCRPVRVLILATFATAEGHTAAASALVAAGRELIDAGEVFDKPPPGWIVDFQREQVRLAKCCCHCAHTKRRDFTDPEYSSVERYCSRWETEVQETDTCDRFAWREEQ